MFQSEDYLFNCINQLENACLKVGESGNPFTAHSASVEVAGQLALVLVNSERANPEGKPAWRTDKLAEYVVNLFDEKWLEDYVFSCLQAIAQDCGIHEIKKNTKIKRLEHTGNSSRFEYDVTAMSGYRLIAFSSSITSNIKVAKLKLFEAYLRAKQIGGDEARFALVCGYPQPQNLMDEISES